MNLSEIRRKIYALLNRALAERWSRGEFLREADKIAGSFLDKAEFKNALYSALSEESEFIKRFSMTKAGREILIEVHNSLTPYYAKTKRGLRDGLKEIFTDSLKKGELTKTLQNRIEAKIGTARNYAQTITRTAIRGFDSVARTTGEDKNARYTYVGPPAERPFCQKLLYQSAAGRTWTREEIARLDNDQDLPCFMYGGGWKCRHHWQATGTIRKK